MAFRTETTPEIKCKTLRDFQLQWNKVTDKETNISEFPWKQTLYSSCDRNEMNEQRIDNAIHNAWW